MNEMMKTDHPDISDEIDIFHSFGISEFIFIQLVDFFIVFENRRVRIFVDMLIWIDQSNCSRLLSLHSVILSFLFLSSSKSFPFFAFYLGTSWFVSHSRCLLCTSGIVFLFYHIPNGAIFIYSFFLWIASFLCRLVLWENTMYSGFAPGSS